MFSMYVQLMRIYGTFQNLIYWCFKFWASNGGLLNTEMLNTKRLHFPSSDPGSNKIKKGLSLSNTYLRNPWTFHKIFLKIMTDSRMQDYV